uniref:Uncharacterized protein n=1 Tax=Chrysotila carterae TaxID=13221 RepID=A0A7S4F241_CHRCT
MHPCGLPGGGFAAQVLTMAAREFMQRKGKSFRPMLVLLIGRATDPDFSIGPRHYKLAVISEMIHTASLIHDNVLEEGEVDTTQGTLVHQEVNVDVGNKVCILAGDFLLAKAAVELSLLDCAEVTEIVARGLESICEGGMLAYDAGQRDGIESVPTLDEYLHITHREISELIGNCCQCSAIISGHAADSAIAQACLLFGLELGMAQQLVAEADEMEALLKQCRRSPRKWPRAVPLSAPLLHAADAHPQLRDMIKRGFSEAQDAASAIALIDKSDAVRHTQELAERRAQEAAEALELLPNSATRTALVVLCHKVLAGAPLK